MLSLQFLLYSTQYLQNIIFLVQNPQQKFFHFPLSLKTVKWFFITELITDFPNFILRPKGQDRNRNKTKTAL